MDGSLSVLFWWTAFAGGHLSDVMFFGGLGSFAALGGLHQDARQRAARGAAAAGYYAETSIVPFAAIVSGRTRLTVSALAELPWLGLGLGSAAAMVLYLFHSRLF